MSWLAGILVIAAVVVVLRPEAGRRPRGRLRAVRPASGPGTTDPPPPGTTRRVTGPRTVPDLLGRGVDARPRLAVGVAALLAAGLGTVCGGPVAAAIAAAYAATGTVAALRARASRAAASRRASALDGLALLAADLRAGTPAGLAVPVAAGAAYAGPVVEGDRSRAPGGGDGTDLPGLTRALCALSQRTGAPIADLVERVEADARAADRARASAAAQAAGVRATAMLLAVLPLAGIGLGYAIGADPARVLLHTPLGAGCALSAVALQLAGLAWTRRLSRIRSERP